MKKLLLILLCLPMIFSCGEKKEGNKDKFKKVIKEPCDALDYSTKIFKGLEDLSDKYRNIDELENNKKNLITQQVDDYFDDLEDVWKYAFKKFPDELEISFDVKDVNLGLGLCYNGDSEDELEKIWDEIELVYPKRLGKFEGFLSDVYKSLKNH